MSGRELNTILIVVSYSTQKRKTQSGKLNISSSTQNTSCPKEILYLIYKNLLDHLVLLFIRGDLRKIQKK